MKFVGIGLCALLVAAVLVNAVRSDSRLVGTYRPDVEATFEVWKPFDHMTIGDTANILHQIFQDAPVVVTPRSIAMKANERAVTNAYMVLWKTGTGCGIFIRPFSFFTIRFAGDGMWMRQRGIFSDRTELLHVKMKKE